MGEAQIRTTYDAIFTYNVTAPGSGSAYASVYSLLSGAQQSELASIGNGYFICGMALFSAAQAINYQHATPLSNPPVVSPNAAPQAVNANQKPNEYIAAVNAHLTTFIRSQAAGAATVQVTLFAVSKDTL